MKNMLKNRKDKKMAVKLSSESQLLQVSRDDFDFKIKKLLEKTDKRTKNLQLVFIKSNKTMSTIVTAIQQSVGMLNHKVGQDIPNRMRMLSPQTNQNQMHSIKCISIKCISNKCAKTKLPIKGIPSK